MEILISSQLILSAIMMGIIWQVQILTYPQLRHIPKVNFPAYHISHTKRMGLIVILPMTLEIILAILTLIISPSLISITGFTLVLAIWASTGLLQVPAHNKLTKKYDPQIIQKLITTNWIRTILWTLRTALLFYWSI